MSKLIATTADEMLAPAGTAVSVMGQYDDLDADLPGKVVLASTNMMPNPDLTKLDERGRVEGWDIDAPPSPDSWNVYIKRTHKYVGGTLTRIGGKTADDRPMLRQNQSLLRWKEQTYQQDIPLLTDKSLPDTGRDEDQDLAPVLDAPRAKAINASGGAGYPAAAAGALKCSYFGILDDHPQRSKRITPAAPAIDMPAIVQGQSVVFYIPDELPDSWTGIGFCVGPDIDNMRIQKRVDLRGRSITEVVDPGPYRKDGTKVTTTTKNLTRVGDFEELDKPKVWHDRSPFNLKSETYEFAYQLKTKQGWSASSKVNKEVVVNDQNSEALRWIPHESALRQPGVLRWRPLFKARNDAWYTFVDAYANGYPLHHAATVHGTQVEEKWKHSKKPKKVGNGRPEKDSSGVPAPQDPMDTPVAQGGQAMLPGRYAVRVTTANSRLGIESRPSPRATVTLAETSSGSGVTDQIIRVFRPAGQTIRNSRLVEVDKNDGSTELHWERPAGVTEVTVNDGVLGVVSASGTGTKVYRRSSIEPVDSSRFYAVRFRMDVNSIGGSSNVNVKLRFISAAADDPANPNKPIAAPTVISTVVLDEFTAVDDRHVKYTFGPADSSAHFDMPAGTKFIQLEVTGNSATARTFDFAISNAGVWVGRAFPRKVYDLVLADDTPEKDSWPVPDSEGSFHTINYPAGPYCRTVTNPQTPALHRAYTQTEAKGFEDNTLTGTNSTTFPGLWTASATAGGANMSVSDLFSISGQYGARATVTSSSAAYSAYISKSFSAHTPAGTFGLEGQFRIKDRPNTGTVGLLGVTKTSTATDYLAYAQLSSTGALTMQYLNAAGTPTTSSAVLTNVLPGDDLRIDFGFTNLGSAGTAVTMRVKRNDRDVVTTGALTTLASSQVNLVFAGFYLGSASGVTARVLIDSIRTFTSAVGETTAVPGSLQEYWAPEGQPAGNPDYFMTGVRYPVKPGKIYVDTAYLAHDGITTPATGADVFMMTSYDADGNEIQNHGYLATGLKGMRRWERYANYYTAPAGAAYVQYTRNHVGDGLIWAMGFQHEEVATLNTPPTQFTNLNDNLGSFSVIFDTTLSGGPKDADVSINSRLIRVRIAATQMYNPTTGALQTSTSFQTRGADTLAKLATATYGAADTVTVVPSHRYIEVKTTLNGTTTVSPEVRAVWIDMERDRPILTRSDGRDFVTGAFVYNVTPSSPVPNVVRKEMADGSISIENIGRGRVPERMTLSIQTFNEISKRQIERNSATSSPLYNVELDGTRYLISMVPQFTGGSESAPDGTDYFDYVAEGVEADVLGTEDM